MSFVLDMATHGVGGVRAGSSLIFLNNKHDICGAVEGSFILTPVICSF